MNHKLIIGWFLIFLFLSCNEKVIQEKEEEVKKIHYNIRNHLVNQLVLDSIIRIDYTKITHCLFNNYDDTTEIVFYYEKDDVSPWTDEMILRTNRFLKIDSFEIPVIFEFEFLYVIKDSIMSQPSVGKTYNWLSYAILKLDVHDNLIEYSNPYEEFAREISERGRTRLKEN